jgi:hypothetical protein
LQSVSRGRGRGCRVEPLACDEVEEARVHSRASKLVEARGPRDGRKSLFSTVQAGEVVLTGAHSIGTRLQQEGIYEHSLSKRKTHHQDDGNHDGNFDPICGINSRPRQPRLRPTFVIMIPDHWKLAASMEWIREQIAQFSEGVSQRMFFPRRRHGLPPERSRSDLHHRNQHWP